MKQIIYSTNQTKMKATFLSLSFIALLVPVLSGQGNSAIDRSSLDNPSARPAPNNPAGWLTAPSFSDEEEEDIGVQYLLIAQPKHEWFSFVGDESFSITDNPLALEDPDRGTTLNVFSAALALDFKPKSFAGGLLKPKIGVRMQWYRYGTFNGRSRVIGGLPIKQNDFESRSPFIEVSWEKTNWFLYAGVRYNDLRQDDAFGSSVTFYKDVNPTVSVARRFVLKPKVDLWMQYTGDLRLSETEMGGILPDEWNDRLTNSLSLTVNKIMGERMLLQSGYTFQYVTYLEDSRDRQDHLHVANLTLIYAINKNLQIRAYGTFEYRGSDEDATSDYRKFEVGLAAQYSLSF